MQDLNMLPENINRPRRQSNFVGAHHGRKYENGKPNPEWCSYIVCTYLYILFSK